ncbi:MAG: glycosyltransferase family 4 protein [Rhizomicrobium sp.]
MALKHSDTMRIWYVYGGPFPNRAAHAVNIAKMCDAFSANGHEVTLVVEGDPANREAIAQATQLELGLSAKPNIWCCKIRRIFGRYHLMAAKIAWAARRDRADIVYARNPVFLVYAVLVGLRVIFEVHSPIDSSASQMKLLFALLRRSAKLARVVVISEALRNETAMRSPNISDRITVAHDGADAEQQGCVRVPIVPARPGRTQIGYAGHLYPGKGMDLIAELASRCPWADFLVVGGTDDAVATWRARLATLPNILLVGFVDHARVPNYLAGCQAVLAPYQSRVQVSDGRTDVARWMSPLKIFEYMAQGKAILCSDLPVLREILTDNETALLCPPDDVSAWTVALAKIASDPTLAKSLGQRARAALEANYTWKARAERVLSGLPA